MAQIPLNGVSPQPDPPQFSNNLASWAGAIVSLGLVVGAGVWGYKLLVRDVTGIPVVRAIDGPMREQPDDPGGLQAAHQGLSVNNVAAEGTAAAPADRLVLAPPPIQLDTNDAPADPNQSAALVVPPAPAEENSEPRTESITSLAPIQSNDVDNAIDQVLASVTAETVETPAAQSEPAPRQVTEGLGTSLRPKLRPAKRSAPAPVEVASAAQNIEVAAGTLPAGTRLVQLGAFASAEIARAEWDKLQGKFGDYLSDKQRVVQKAESGGRTFYRLRAMGFADLSDARRLCSALKAENADCIPVVTR